MASFWGTGGSAYGEEKYLEGLGALGWHPPSSGLPEGVNEEVLMWKKHRELLKFRSPIVVGECGSHLTSTWEECSRRTLSLFMA